MSININDLNNNFNQNGSNNLRELSERELKTYGGAGNPNLPTVIFSDEDIDVYIIDNYSPAHFVNRSNLVNIESNRTINFDNGSATMRENGNLDITFSDSDSSSSSS